MLVACVTYWVVVGWWQFPMPPLDGFTYKNLQGEALTNSRIHNPHHMWVMYSAEEEMQRSKPSK
jgi:hypothetical protein